MYSETLETIEVSQIILLFFVIYVPNISTISRILKNIEATIAIAIQEINEVRFSKRSNRMPLLSGNIFRHVQSENLSRVTSALSVERSNSLWHTVYYFYSFGPSGSSKFQWDVFRTVPAKL